jgi:hypothetical protein
MAEVSELLKNRRLSDHYSLLVPLGFFIPLLVGSVLARGNLIEGAPLGLHLHVEVSARAWRARNVGGDPYDDFVASARFRELRDQRMADTGRAPKNRVRL